LQKTTETASYCKTYTYDLAGNRTGFTLEKGDETVHNISYSYDNLNRLSTVSENGAIEATYTYDANGNRATLTLGNGVTTTYSYNLANWVTNLSNKNSSGATLSSYAYTYYASGNQKSKTDNTGKVTSYVYDGLGRLTSESESNGVTLSYTYDSAGNRTKLTATGTESYVIDYTYNSVNQLTSEVKTEGGAAEITTYTYDNNGNLVAKTSPEGTQANTYNNLNQLVSSITAGVTSSYTYNVDGIRTSKTVGTATTDYLLDGGNVVAESQNGETTATYLRGANLLSTDNGASTSYYLFNAHGDVTGLTNGAQTVTKSYDYDAFGNEKDPSATDANPFRYCGEYFDKETGTYYLRARYYDPVIGRFTSQDSVRYTERPLPTGNVIDPLSLNYYTYSANNPVMYCDPSGNVWETIFDIVSLGASFIEALEDPTDGWLWVGVAADAVDLIPFVTGVGEVTRAVRIADNITDAVDDAHDAKNVGDVVLKPVAAEKELGTVSGALGIEEVNSWQEAEKSLRKLIGDTSTGNKARTFQTNTNKRIWDAYNPATKTAAESKYGYASLSKFIQSEIDRDIYLRNMEVVDNIEWHFYVSNITGKGGPSEALKNKLIENRINIVLH